MNETVNTMDTNQHLMASSPITFELLQYTHWGQNLLNNIIFQWYHVHKYHRMFFHVTITLQFLHKVLICMVSLNAFVQKVGRHVCVHAHPCMHMCVCMCVCVCVCACLCVHPEAIIIDII